jgi:chromosome segregation ATPase
MEETAMELTPKHLEIIGDYVRGHIAEWIEPVKALTLDEWHRDMQERVIRIEETVRLGFDFMEKRFEQVDKRFEQVEKRFEQVDKRFEQVEKRFEQVDKRFDDLIHFMDKRFEQVDKRFEQVDKRFDQQFKFITVGFLMIGVLMSVYQFLA